MGQVIKRQGVCHTFKYCCLCVGLAATVVILVNGIWQMRKGDPVKSQRMMRLRVLAQGVTVLALVGGVMLSTRKATKE